MIDQKLESEAKRRFEPVSVDAWNKNFSTGINDLDSKYLKHLERLRLSKYHKLDKIINPGTSQMISCRDYQDKNLDNPEKAFLRSKPK